MDSEECVKVLLTQMFQRLQLKEKNISCLASATDTEIAEIWESLQLVDSECVDDP